MMFWKGSGRLRNSATPQAQRPCLSSSFWCKVELNSQANIEFQSVIRVAWRLVTKTRRIPLSTRKNADVRQFCIGFLTEIHTLYTLYALTLICFNSEIRSIKFTLGQWGSRYSPVRRPDPLCRLWVWVSGADRTRLCLTHMLKWVLCRIDWRSAL